ncbi:MAG: chaperone modulatory protein CbpM [Halieaceae bacterium]|nr:chaperone modulatory protein CbpM [Halieaceae bacterium]
MLEHYSVQLSLIEVCQSVSMSSEVVVEIVEQGIVEPRGSSPGEWVFDARMVSVVRRACRLHSDLDIDWSGIGLAIELLDQLEQLRAENKQLKQRLLRFTGE